MPQKVKEQQPAKSDQGSSTQSQPLANATGSGATKAKGAAPAPVFPVDLSALLGVALVICAVLSFLLVKAKGKASEAQEALSAAHNKLRRISHESGEGSTARRDLENERKTVNLLRAEVDKAQTAQFQAEAALAEAGRISAQADTKGPRQLSPVAKSLVRTRDWIQTALGTDAATPALAQVDGMLKEALRADGVEEVASAGLPFDPSFHTAVSTVETQAPDKVGQVLKTVRAGYRFGDVLVRPEEVILTVKGDSS